MRPERALRGGQATMIKTDAEIEAALETCAQEPVHIPGTIQGAGALLAYDPETYLITHASENISDILDIKLDDVIGCSATDVLGNGIIHNINNARYQASFETRTHSIDFATYRDQTCEVSAHSNGQRIIVEFEPSNDVDPPVSKVMDEITQLLDQMKDEDQEQPLMAKAVDLLRTFSGFDRVVAYRFDKDYNGEVIAEEKSGKLAPFMGLRFPQWDIPAQAREMMLKIPLRFIFDVDQRPVPLISIESTPLDISLSPLRGVSEVHMQYVRNMGAAATMTLNIQVEGKLWGVISFHHSNPRTPSPHVRRVCAAVLRFLEARLPLILTKSEIAAANKIEALRDQINTQFRYDVPLSEIFPELANLCMDALSAQGIVLTTPEGLMSNGHCPNQRIIEALINLTPKDGTLLATDSISELIDDVPKHSEIAGALVARLSSGQSLALFRESKVQSITWAGPPAKEIELTGPKARLTPRASFDAYQQTVRGKSEQWTQLDILLCERLAWTITNVTHRNASSEAQKRQQDVMIGELNHRVRNILALIKSVSRQARTHHASIESYREALEQRINSLAAAHDLGTNNQRDAISVQSIIKIEAAPFTNLNSNRIKIEGDDFWIKADQAPLFALVIHELMTNAAKYGALSSDNGMIDIKMSGDNGKAFTWREQGGPAVAMPTEYGFGTTLIKDSVPFELGGTCELQFLLDGVLAKLWLPETVLDWPSTTLVQEKPNDNEELQLKQIADAQNLPVLIVEDNFMVATDLKATVKELGIQNIEMASNPTDALSVIEDGPVGFAFLDVNLGASGLKSFDVAWKLKEAGTPFAFITGYGEDVELPRDLADAMIVTKPAQRKTLLAVLASKLS